MLVTHHSPTEGLGNLSPPFLVASKNDVINSWHPKQQANVLSQQHQSSKASLGFPKQCHRNHLWRLGNFGKGETHWKRGMTHRVKGAPPNHFPIWFGLVRPICAAKFLAGMWDFGSHLIKIGVNQIGVEKIGKKLEAGWARLDWILYRFWKPDLIKHTCHRFFHTPIHITSLKKIFQQKVTKSSWEDTFHHGLWNADW